MIRRVVLVAALGIAAAPLLGGKEQRGQPAASPPVAAKAAAPIDLAGNWVSIVTEDWRWRMVTPAKGDYASIPMTPAAKMVADGWDPRGGAGRRGEGGEGAAGKAEPKFGNLKVVTTHMRPGYLRKNGVPYSADAELT